MPKSLSPLAIFRNRAFTLLWSGQLVSTVGSALSSLVASILVFRLTGSAISVGLMLMATAATLADFDALAVLLPTLAVLPAKERASLVGRSSVLQAPPGACLLRRGETGDAAYFILSGRAVAGLPQPDGSYNALSTLQPGDFFGEIAALTGARRTADVAAEDTTTLFQVPAPALRALMANPALSQLVLTKMTERLSRTSLSELPRFAGLDQEALKELRMKEEV